MDSTKKELIPPEIAKESGYDEHLQRLIIKSLGPKERIAIRSILEGSTEMEKKKKIVIQQVMDTLLIKNWKILFKQ